MLSPVLEAAVNKQIQHEFNASHLYLQMSAYCEAKSFSGFSQWLRMQSQEEHEHGMKLYDFVLSSGSSVTLEEVAKPDNAWGSFLELFIAAYEYECETTRQIHQLYEVAQVEKAYAIQAQLQWFLTEQVEEENVASDVVEKLKLIGSDPAALLAFDREMSTRSATESGV